MESIVSAQLMESASSGPVSVNSAAAGGGGIIRNYTSTVSQINFVNTGIDEWTFTLKIVPDEIYSTKGLPYCYSYSIIFFSNGQSTPIFNSSDNTQDVQHVVSGNGPGTYAVIQQYLFDNGNDNIFYTYSNMLLRVDGNINYTKLLQLNGIRMTEISHYTFKAELIVNRENCDYYPVYLYAHFNNNNGNGDPNIIYITNEAESQKDVAVVTLQSYNTDTNQC